MGVELKVTAEDVRMFYSGSGWAEFRAKVASRGDDTILDPNVLVSPMNSIVSAFNSWFGGYLKEVLGKDFGAYKDAVSRYAETYRSLILVAGRNARWENAQRENPASLIEKLSDVHHSQLFTFAALFNRVVNESHPASFDEEAEEMLKNSNRPYNEYRKQYVIHMTKFWELMKKDIVTLVAIADRLYNPQTTSEVIAQIKEGGNLNKEYRERLYAMALHN